MSDLWVPGPRVSGSRLTSRASSELESRASSELESRWLRSLSPNRLTPLLTSRPPSPKKSRTWPRAWRSPEWPPPPAMPMTTSMMTKPFIYCSTTPSQHLVVLHVILDAKIVILDLNTRILIKVVDGAVFGRVWKGRPCRGHPVRSPRHCNDHHGGRQSSYYDVWPHDVHGDHPIFLDYVCDDWNVDGPHLFREKWTQTLYHSTVHTVGP